MANKKDELIKILGPENVIDDPETLESYSRDQSFVSPRKPRLVINPNNVDEVQEIVKWANQTSTPLVPVSSGPPHFRGDTVPTVPEAVIVDLSGMKRITSIDRRNRFVMIEPGVTFGQLQGELAKEGLRLSAPLLPRSSKSVITSLLEREPTLIPRYRYSMLEPLRALTLVWGNGERFNTGSAGSSVVPPLVTYGPGQADWGRFVAAAQGSIGIVTSASLRCKLLPQLRKIFFVTSEKLDDLLGFAYKVLRFRYGDEFLFLNNSNLASILGEGPDQIRALREKLPSWVLILGVAGRSRLPKKRVEFQQKDITDIAQQFSLQLLSSIPGASDGQVLEAMLSPSGEPYWKLGCKGGCQDIFFLTTLNMTLEFVRAMYSVAEALGYSTSDIGIYIQPEHMGVCCHCEFSLPYNPSNPEEVAKVQGLFTEASEKLMKQGAFFSRPYGIWADMVYKRDAQAAVVLRKVRGIFDPNGVMNPGKLCF